MSLTRYQFEVLSFLAENGDGLYPVRSFSDTICVSGNEILRCVEFLASNNYIKVNNEEYSVTDLGLKALEPYRVNKAIILAAGFGSRMLPATENRPKPMVTVNGVRIIDTLIDALVKSDIKDITIIRGHKKEVFDELLDKYPFITLIDNDDYNRTNNISSVMLALDKLDHCYLCEADLYISNPDIIKKYQYASNILGSYSLETDDWSFRMNDGYITDYQKGNTYCYNYYGISYWTPEDCIKLREDFRDVFESDGGKDYFWEFIPLILKKENYAVEIRQCKKQDIIEIDNYYELAQLDPSYRV